MGSLMRSPPIGLSSESIYYLPFLQCSATSSHSFPSYYFTRRGLGFFLTPSPVWIVKTQAKLSRHRCSRVRLGSFRLDSRYRFMGRLSGLLDHLEDDQGDEHEEQQAHQNGRRHGWTNEREGEGGDRCGTARDHHAVAHRARRDDVNEAYAREEEGRPATERPIAADREVGLARIQYRLLNADTRGGEAYGNEEVTVDEGVAGEEAPPYVGELDKVEVDPPQAGRREETYDGCDG